MRPIEFIGIRGGHCASTVALVAALSLAARGPTRLAAHDSDVMCSLAGASSDRHMPIVLSENLDLVAGEDHGDVIDAGTLESYLDDEPFDDELAARRHSTAGRLVVGVLRGPDYLGLRTLCGHQMFRPCMTFPEGTRSVLSTVVREWHRLACCASATS